MHDRYAVLDLEIDLFLEALFSRYGHDFRRYARPTLRRRLMHAQRKLQCDSVSMLQHRLLREPALLAELLGYLTVHVSDFFRDPPFYATLRERVVPLLRTYPSLRVWVAGCSTGEELYSLAILLDEEDLLARTIMYATDVSAEALRAAERGVYAAARVPQFSENYAHAGGQHSLANYYTAAYDNVVFDKRLRKNVVFSDHSLATDTVFAEIQLVTCRNVLIYFDETLRDRALGLFRESLVRKGFLALGAKESLRSSQHAAAFAELDRPARIYQKQ